MKIIIRNEQKKDYRITEQLTRDAFWNKYVPGASEHYLVHTMRTHPDYVKNLSYVLEVDGIIRGAIFYTHSHIIQADGTKLPTITFGPICIDPNWQNQGLGRKLIEFSLAKATVGGYAAVMILGDWNFYEHIGFKRGKCYGVMMGDGHFYKGLLLYPLNENTCDLSGVAHFSTVFEYDPQAVEDFDTNFTPKVKQHQLSQDEFAQQSIEKDE